MGSVFLDKKKDNIDVKVGRKYTDVDKNVNNSKKAVTAQSDLHEVTSQHYDSRHMTAAQQQWGDSWQLQQAVSVNSQPVQQNRMQRPEPWSQSQPAVMTVLCSSQPQQSSGCRDNIQGSVKVWV